MKIIAKVSDDRFIVEIPGDSLRKIGGLSYGFKLDVGHSVDVHEDYKFIEQAKSAVKEIHEAISSLGSAKLKLEVIEKKANKAIYGKVKINE